MSQIRRRFLLASAVVFATACAFSCWAISFSTDFDGIGSGGGFTIDFGSRGSGGWDYGGRDDPVYDHVRQRYDEQRREAEREAKRRAEEVRLREERERAALRKDVERTQRALEALQQLENDEPNYRLRMQYAKRVEELEKEFASARNRYLVKVPTIEQRLASSLNLINVPPPPHPLHYRSILIWGFLSTPEEAEQASRNGKRNPFDGTPFDKVFAFGSKSVKPDLDRVGWDEIMSYFGQLSPATAQQLKELRGATADEVVCHSNGCRIAYVLIGNGALHVKRLRILGGDGVLMDVGRLEAFRSKNKLSDIAVYVVNGDHIPLIPVGWAIKEATGIIGRPLGSFSRAANDLTYQFLGLSKNPGYNAKEKVQVHVLSHPGRAKVPFFKHRYDTYSSVLAAWKRAGCLEPGGTLNGGCVFHPGRELGR